MKKTLQIEEDLQWNSERFLGFEERERKSVRK